MSLVLCLVMLAQIRLFQGLATSLAFLDQSWAFDVAIHAGMKVNAWLAGISGTDWLLIDDVLDMDTQYLELAGLASDTFALACGTAQGRRFSVHLFNGLLRGLPDEIEKVIPGGTKCVLPAFAADALIRADEIRPATSVGEMPTGVGTAEAPGREQHGGCG